jgi:hypothetical protein
VTAQTGKWKVVTNSWGLTLANDSASLFSLSLGVAATQDPVNLTCKAGDTGGMQLVFAFFSSSVRPTREMMRSHTTRPIWLANPDEIGYISPRQAGAAV